jgi:hypothetical protein
MDKALGSYCCSIVAKPPALVSKSLGLIRDLQEQREPTSGLEPLTCLLGVTSQLLQGFA